MVGPTVVSRQLQGMQIEGGPAGLRLLDAVVWPELRNGRPGRTLRIFFANPAFAGQIAALAPEGGFEVIDRREVAGGVMVHGRAAPEGPLLMGLCPEAVRPVKAEDDADAPAPVAAPQGPVVPLEITPAPAETDLFAGKFCLLAQRLEETALGIADWLSWHHDLHEAEAALILDRSPPDSAALHGAALARAIAHELETRELAMTVVVLSSDTPLGKPDHGPENHPFHAPDAPGKDRMEVPPNDPWRAPLGQGIVLEVAKWRFLAHARAVLQLDVTDILQPRPEGTPSAFEGCLTSATGMVTLVGRRIYPWRVRGGTEARFSDHLCRQFDATRGIARWGVAPGKVGLESTWRLLRIAYTKPDPASVFSFWRAMGLRVPGRAASELAPKTSLIEDPELLRVATEIWGAKPIRPPVSKPRPAPVRAAEAGRTCIVTTMKNEGPFILEWIAYHRAIGVDDFLIYTNDCTDGTDTMLDMLQRKGICQHRDNPFRTMDMPPQHAALESAEKEPLIQNCGWAICMDVDEFIDVKIGDGTLRALYDAMGDANMIALTWRLFGNCDVHAYQDRFLIEQFTTCAPEIVRKPHQAWGFKTLFRNIDIYKKLGVHRPKGLLPDLWDQVNWLNGSGKPMPREMFRNGWRSTATTYGYDWVQLNHYAVRSAESFLVKRDRGRVNHVDRDQGLNYWFRMNHNAVEERSIQRMIPRARAEFERLLSDPEIRAAHEHSVAAHRAKIAELRSTEAYANFYAELCSERFEKLSRILHVFGSAVFNAGPGVIPADLPLENLPPGFFFTVEHEGEANH